MVAISKTRIEDQLRDAFAAATREIDVDDLEIVVDIDVQGRVGAVAITETGALVLNDDNAVTIDEALAEHDWETGVSRLVEDGLRVSVWEVDG